MSKPSLFRKFLIFASALSFTSASAGSVVIDVTNLRNSDGQLLAILFSQPDGFPGEISKAAAATATPVVSGQNLIRFSDLAPGTYALALIHDENGNNALDFGLFGIPKEPIGFSNNPKLGFSAPTFEKAAFQVSGDVQVTVKMKHY